MNRVHLESGGWVRSGSSQARGGAHLDDCFLDAGNLAAKLDGCATDAAWMEIVGRLNGCFALVSVRAGGVLAAVDRIRSIPLFYSAGDEGVCLSDDAYRVMRASTSSEVNEVAGIEFHLTGYVTGAETLHSGVSQLEAGELMAFALDPGSRPVRRRYYDFRHQKFFSTDTADLVSRLESVHSSVFRRLVESTNGRTMVVPLSGGYDSRLIGVSLRDLGARNVICYSYGAPGNWESRISEELARYLGFRWEFVPYSKERWRTWGASDRFREYFHSAGNLVSVPHIQDWPAVCELQQEARVPVDSIFVPGHSGDFLAGSHIPKFYAERSTLSRREVLDSLQDVHYSLWDWPAGQRSALRDHFDRRIESIAGPIMDGSAEVAADAFERWDLRERQAKFICNSVRVYENFGFEWRLPLFDNELMDFWSRVPVHLRVGRSLYFEFTRRRQVLPVTNANQDHHPIVGLMINGIDQAGLRPVARRVQRKLRRLRWKHAYESSSLAWLNLIDRDHFRRTYTGKELMHSYLALRYRDHATSLMAELREASVGDPRPRRSDH